MKCLFELIAALAALAINAFKWIVITFIIVVGLLYGMCIAY